MKTNFKILSVIGIVMGYSPMAMTSYHCGDGGYSSDPEESRTKNQRSKVRFTAAEMLEIRQQTQPDPELDARMEDALQGTPVFKKYDVVGTGKEAQG